MTIPEGVTSIGDYAFDWCTSLTSVTIPEGVTNIGNCAFYNCRGLTSVTIPEGVTSIGDNALLGCTALASLTVPRGMEGLSLSGLGLDASAFVSVNLDANGGSGDVVILHKIGQPLTGLTVPTRGGYAFDGWFDALEGGARMSSAIMVSSNATYYAHWVEVPFAFADDADWTYEFDGVWRSGDIHSGESSSAVLGVVGPGLLSFRWKSSTECDLETGAVYDYAYLAIDGVASGGVDGDNRLWGQAIGGSQDWTNVVLEIAGTDEHAIVWTYSKDACDEIFGFEDCVWLADVAWTPRVLLTFSLGGGKGATPADIAPLSGSILALPSTEGFSRPKHAFVGWSDGERVYPAGADYEATTSNVSFVALWRAKTLEDPVISCAQVANGGEVSDAETVTLSISAEDHATIHYTIDGSTPNAASPVYENPIVLTSFVATVKAVAVCDDYFDSQTSTFSFTRLPYTLSECLGLEDVDGVEVWGGGDGVAWHRVLGSEVHSGIAGLRSGSLTHNQTNWVEMTASGPGTVMFWWKASSESIRGKPRDGAVFFADGNQVGDMIGGVSNEWARVSYSVDAEGPHEFRWAYCKSGMDSADVGDDCVWLDDVVWVPKGSAAVEVGNDGKVMIVPKLWLDGHDEAIEALGGDRGAYVDSVAANGRKVWECYVLGLDPEVATNDFRITAFPMKVDGTPDLEKLTFAPPKSEWNVQSAVPKLKGRARLESGEWQDVPAGGDPSFRLFKIEVELP